MDYYFYNTDAQSLHGDRRFPVLIERGFAATGGPLKYGRKFGKLRPGDQLLMYENRIGVVAVGTVSDRWDREEHEQPLYYVPGVSFKVGSEHEYRIKVDWDLDLSEKPLSFDEIKQLTGSMPSTTLKKINNPGKISKRLAELRRAAAPSTPEATDLTKPGRVETTTYRILRDTDLARRVKMLHNYECQICGHTIKFPDGSRYAEAHHIQPLGKPHHGDDCMGNIISVCPNHHAELDYGVLQLNLRGVRVVKGHTVDPKYVAYHNEKIYKAKGR